jgi:hypothetical protein
MKIYYTKPRYCYWAWHDIFKELINYLQNKYNAELIFNENDNTYLAEYDYTLQDCDMLVYDEENDILKGLTFSENKVDFLNKVFHKRNNPNDFVLLTQFYNWFPDLNQDDQNFIFKVKPTSFYPYSANMDYDVYYHKRQQLSYDDLNDKMFLLYTTEREDGPILRNLELLSENPGSLSLDGYLNLAIQHRIGLSITGVAEICHRDFEYMAIGLPMLRLKYMNKLDPPLIANYHYIAVNRDNLDWDVHKNRIGGETYVEAYKNRYLEVKDDKDFLDFISKNAREYYKKYSHPTTRLTHLLKLLNLN